MRVTTCKVHVGGGGGLRVGQRVVARWQQGVDYYAARVTRVHDDGTFDLLYDEDGAVEVRVAAKFIRQVLEGAEEGDDRAADAKGQEGEGGSYSDID